MHGFSQYLPFSDYSAVGGLQAFRWGGCAHPGKWFASVSMPSHCHVHLQCVVDDFGSLVPVDLAAMTATGFINYGEAQ